MKRILAFLCFVASLFLIMNAESYGQTNVSGGIYSNTTWTLNNSPYIVTDSVVLFPGDTLIIEPGVVVEFYNNQILEIRQATLIAEGTSSDSITFTSFSNNPIPGIWQGVLFTSTTTNPVYAKLNYCNIFYANGNGGGGNNIHDSIFVSNSSFNYNSQYGLNFQNIYSINVDSCVFEYNGTGMNLGGATNSYFHGNSTGINLSSLLINCLIDSNKYGVYDMYYLHSKIVNCTITNNTKIGVTLGFSYGIFNSIIDSNATGILLENGDLYNDTVNYCEIKYNGTGITDSGSFIGSGQIIQNNDIENNYIGMKIIYSDNIITCNTICNNSFYDLYTMVSGNLNSNWYIGENYWCSNDSATIQSFIYDGYNNINYALVYFEPFDTMACNSFTTGINSQNMNPNDFIKIYPNPATTTLTIHQSSPSTNQQLIITDVLGNEVYHQPIINQQSSVINISQLSNGIYFYDVINDKGEARGKFVKEK